MASSIPTQERIVDPFASYNSNVVNKITQIVTQDSNGLLTTNSLQVTQVVDSTSLNVVSVSDGFAVQDNVVINITEAHRVDFDDQNQYVSGGSALGADGYYYLVMDYTYAKSRPAPQASIKILRPAERSAYSAGGQFLLLKIVQVASSEIVQLLDYDPENESNQREFLKRYTGTEAKLPTFDQDRDQSRMVYELDRNKFYFGYREAWGELSAGGVSIDLNTDSTGVVLGSLCYIDENRDAIPALATNFFTCADLSVLSIGTALEGTGRGSIAGFVEQVPVQPGVVVGIGDLLYLSATTPGTVTNERSSPLYQVVGRALSAGSSTTPIEMIFSPKVPLVLSLEGQITSWSGPDTNGYYYYDIDTSILDGTNAYVCSWWDNSTHKEIIPVDVEIKALGDDLRVTMPDNTKVIDYVILSPSSTGGASGGGGGGGGGGVSDHALLTSLDYSSSGHTGFAPTAHTHVDGDPHNYNDIPSGETILFESDTAVTGYSLLTDIDDGVVYFTKGSGSGGEGGGTNKSGGTWTQPDHNHVIVSSGTHNHSITHTHSVPSHNHKWYEGYGSFNSGGSSTSFTSSTSYGTLGLAPGGGGGESTGPYVTGTYYTNNHSDTTGGSSSANTGSDGNHSHGGFTGSDATANTWRPKGRNFTRQQRS